MEQDRKDYTSSVTGENWNLAKNEQLDEPVNEQPLENHVVVAECLSIDQIEEKYGKEERDRVEQKMAKVWAEDFLEENKSLIRNKPDKEFKDLLLNAVAERLYGKTYSQMREEKTPYIRKLGDNNWEIFSGEMMLRCNDGGKKLFDEALKEQMMEKNIWEEIGRDTRRKGEPID